MPFLTTERPTPPSVAKSPSSAPIPRFALYSHQIIIIMPLKPADSTSNLEGRIQLAIQTYKDGQFKSIRAAVPASADQQFEDLLSVWIGVATYRLVSADDVSLCPHNNKHIY
jgi:hypothetical protein